MEGEDLSDASDACITEHAKRAYKLSAPFLRCGMGAVHPRPGARVGPGDGSVGAEHDQRVTLAVVPALAGNIGQGEQAPLGAEPRGLAHVGAGGDQGCRRGLVDGYAFGGPAADGQAVVRRPVVLDGGQVDGEIVSDDAAAPLLRLPCRGQRAVQSGRCEILDLVRIDAAVGVEVAPREVGGGGEPPAGEADPIRLCLTPDVGRAPF